MPVTLRGTDILFNDNSTQSTAAVGLNANYNGNIAGSRANNTSYTNSTGKYLFVWMHWDPPYSNHSVSLYVNGQHAAYQIMDSYGRATVAGMVPPGGTYYTTSNQGANPTHWFELRA